MKIEDANARLGQDMREAQAQGDTDAVGIIATAMLIYDVPMNLDQFISEIEQHINQDPASEKGLSFALALSYTRKKERRQELYMSDGTANPLISVLETIIETDHILQLPNLPEEFVREIQTEQQEAINIITDFTQKEAPHMPPHFLASLRLEPGKQAQKLLAMLKPMLEPSGESTPKVSKVEELPAEEALRRLRSQMDEYVIPDSLREQLNGQLADVGQLLARASTSEEARTARDKVRECEQRWKKAVGDGWGERVMLRAHTAGVEGVAFSPDGTVLASHSVDVRLWEVSSGHEQAVLGDHKWVRAIAFSPDGATLASRSWDNTLRLWEVASGRERAILRGHISAVDGIAFSPNLRWFASCSVKNVRLWEVKSGREHAVLQPYYKSKWHDGGKLFVGANGMAFSPDSRLLASYSQSEIWLWEVSSGRKLAMLEGHNGKVTEHRIEAIAFSPDGSVIASYSEDKRIRLWEVASKRERAMLSGHTKRITAIAFNPDGTLLASCSEDKTVRLWEVSSGRVRTVLRHTDGVSDIAFSPDGATLASGPRDGTVRLWEVSSGHERAVLRGHTDMIFSIAFNPDGATLASSSSDKTVRLWGQVMPKAEWERQERERQEQARKKQEEQQRKAWRLSGCCEACGTKLGFWDKLIGRTRCQQHR